MPTSSSVANDLQSHLPKKFKQIAGIERLKKEDLTLPNHLIGLKRTFLKVYFHNQDDLTATVRDLHRIVSRNKQRAEQDTTFKQLMTDHMSHSDTNVPSKARNASSNGKKWQDPLNNIADIFEYDMAYSAL